MNYLKGQLRFHYRVFASLSAAPRTVSSQVSVAHPRNVSIPQTLIALVRYFETRAADGSEPVSARMPVQTIRRRTTVEGHKSRSGRSESRLKEWRIFVVKRHLVSPGNYADPSRLE